MTPDAFRDFALVAIQDWANAGLPGELAHVLPHPKTSSGVPHRGLNFAGMAMVLDSKPAKAPPTQ
jgi:hypothetical protein